MEICHRLSKALSSSFPPAGGARAAPNIKTRPFFYRDEDHNSNLMAALRSCGIMGPDLVVRLHRGELAGADRARCVAATRHELSAGRSRSRVWSAEGFQVISGRKAWRDNCWCTRRGKCSFVRPYLCLQLSVSLSTQRGEQLYKQGRP